MIQLEDVMTKTPHALSSLIGSRICHDLISPIGAITNGLELLSLSGAAPGPEMQLIEDSVQHAGARVMFFRVAFGLADATPMPEAEVAGLLRGYAAGARVEIAFHNTGELLRTGVRLACLAIQCLETAMPFGGQITVMHDGARWQITGQSERMQADLDMWQALKDGRPLPQVTPATIQFALIGDALRDMGGTMRLEISPEEIAIRV